MADLLSSLIRLEPGPVLPPFERFAPPPTETLIASEIETRTGPGDIVIELHGRGGWVARAGIDRLRRVYDIEGAAITRLLAEVVLRPPDLRHLDAAVNALAIHPRGEAGLRDALDGLYRSRCSTCARDVIVDEFVWDGGADGPSRKTYRCAFCGQHARHAQHRAEPVDDEDMQGATAAVDAGARDALRRRFPAPDGHPLPDELLDLYTPRNLTAIHAILERIEGELRAPSIMAGLRLALLHVLLPASRLNSYPGRMAALRIAGGRLRPPAERQWRERNVWTLFEEGWRNVRAFLQRLESAPGGTIHARLGSDLLALVEGSANVVVRTGLAAQPGNAPALPAGAATSGRDARSRVRLVLTQAPIRWSGENLAFAYLATSLSLGEEEAATLPLEALFGRSARSEFGWEAAALRRSLVAVRPILAPDAAAVVVLDRGGPGDLVAGVLGGVGAGYTLRSALLTEVGDDMAGVLELSPGPISGRDVHDARGPAQADGPFQLSAVEHAVTDVAVAVLQERGEPARFERLLGEVLIGLDRLGHLRRLVGTRTFTETEQRAEESAMAVGLFGEPATAVPAGAVAGPSRTAAPSSRPSPRLAPLRLRDAVDRPPGATDDGTPEIDAPSAAPRAGAPATLSAAGAWAELASGAGSSSDHVRLLLEIVMGELRRPDHPRLRELEPGRWWLRDERDGEAARLPISDRLEWAVFSLLSTSGTLTEGAFFDRVARMFRGHDTPDEEIVRACLESYRAADSSSGDLRTEETLQARSQEHGTLVGMLAEYGHRLGLRVWVSRREQRRMFKDRPLGDLLSETERHVYLPLITPGPVETLEAMDCIWYLRGKATFLFEVEWTAMLAEPLLRRGRRIPATETLVRFLVIPSARASLVRLKLARSPLLRAAMDEGNWHILKSEHLRRLYVGPDADLESLGPFLGLDPEIERQGEQLPLFG